MNPFQKWWHHIARGAAKGALRALWGKRVEMEKRDTPEDEKLKAREEVEIKVSLFSLFNLYHHLSLFLEQAFFIATLR